MGLGPPAPTVLQRGLGAGSTQRQWHCWCRGGVLEVPSGLVGTIYTKSSLGCRENPCFEKLVDCSYMHVEIGWICPMLPDVSFATKWALMGKKPCCSPPHQGLKIGSFSFHYYLFSIFLKAHWGAFRGLRTVGHVPWPAYYAAVPATPGGLNVAWVTGKTHTSERLILYGTYGHIHRYRGHTQ